MFSSRKNLWVKSQLKILLGKKRTLFSRKFNSEQQTVQNLWKPLTIDDMWLDTFRGMRVKDIGQKLYWEIKIWNKHTCVIDLKKKLWKKLKKQNKNIKNYFHRRICLFTIFFIIYESSNALKKNKIKKLPWGEFR